MVIRIRQSKNADTRTCDVTKVSKDELLSASRQHIGDVAQGLSFFRRLLLAAGLKHDLDKISDIDQFYADFQTGFKSTIWYDRHRQINRHHLDHEDGRPDDVNLIDVLDFVADQVMAGMARSGTVRPVSLPPELLQRALANTAKLLQDQVEVVPDEPKANG